MQQELFDCIYNNLRVLNEYVKKTFEASMAYKYSRAHKKHRCYACHKYGHIAKHCNKLCIYCGSYHGDSFCYRELFNLSNKVISIFLNKTPKEFINELLKFQYIGNGARYKTARERLAGFKEDFIEEDKGDLYKKSEGGLVQYRRISQNDMLQGLMSIIMMYGVKEAYEYSEECRVANEQKEMARTSLCTLYPSMFGYQSSSINQVEYDISDSNASKANEWIKVDDARKYVRNPFRNVMCGTESALVKLRKKVKALKQEVKSKSMKCDALTKHMKFLKTDIANKTYKQQRQKRTFLSRRSHYKQQLNVLNNKKNRIYNNIRNKYENFLDKVEDKKEVLNYGYKAMKKKKLQSALFNEEYHYNDLMRKHPTSSYIELSKKKIERLKQSINDLDEF